MFQHRLIPALAGGLIIFHAAAAAAVSAQQVGEWKTEIRRDLFVPSPLPDLHAARHGTFQAAPGIVAERVTYSTGYGLQVPAILYRPEKLSKKAPGIVVVNGHGGDKYSWYSFYSGILYARAGAVVLTYDAIGEGERNIRRESGTRAHDKLQSPPELAQRLAGLMITDAMQAVSYLRQRPEVDSTRIAAVGYSMGSFVLSLTCAVDGRIHACVLAGGGSLDGPGEYWDSSKPMCQGVPYESLSFLGDRPAIIYTLHAFRGPTLVYNGLDDEIIRHDPRGPKAFLQDLQQRTVALSGTSGHVFETGFEPDAGHRPWFVTKPVALWLERQLHFPNWTPESIERMPVTHISEWAKTNGVEIDNDYATEKREGGTMALGTGVPALTRQQLSVFVPAKWAREKDHLTYEAWVKAARAQLTGTGVLPAYDIHRTSSRIVIDGKLDDPAWAKAPITGPFHFNSWKSGEKEATDVRMLWDNQNLYVAFYAHDRHISAKVTRRHGPVSTDDCVEIFLAPKPQKPHNYYTFEINAIGTMLNRNRTDWWTGPPTWEPEGVSYRTSLESSTPKQESDSDHDWVVELAIPFRNFVHDAAHTPPAPGDIWRLNLYRTGGITNAQQSSWSPLPVRSFHTPTAFGFVQFVADPR
ncbi:MAG TPA: carbohydrate-binding family 9-like protein [Bryobacteraceae bacterium]|nr:carbohydrate-binding family 9-like protein [Bryobacteraceae bacterium]